MEMHQLRYFVAVAQTGNFSRAAERCHVSQPSLSQQIQKLEQRLGQALFHRLGRRAVLTDSGRMLLDRATTILATAENAERQLRAGDESAGGRLAIGAIPTLAPYLLPRALQFFGKRCPRVDLVIREDLTANLVQALVEGELDLAVAALPIGDGRLRSEPILTEHLFAAMARHHPLARVRRPNIQQLTGERFILLNEMHCLGEQIMNFCRANECQPQIACRSAQLATVQALIGLCQGVSLVPDMARRADRTKTIVYRRLAGEQPRRTVAAFRHRHHRLNATADKFVESLQHAGRSLVRSQARSGSASGS